MKVVAFAKMHNSIMLSFIIKYTFLACCIFCVGFEGGRQENTLEIFNESDSRNCEFDKMMKYVEFNLFYFIYIFIFVYC